MNLLSLSILFVLGFLHHFLLLGQSYSNQNYIYAPNIRSVLLTVGNEPIEYPIITLGSNTLLRLQFDDLDAYSKDFAYQVIHCDANWNPSEDIDPMDYIDGFQENRVYDVRSSVSTKIPYVHYEIVIPNEDIRWTKSGNYLLKVFVDGDEDQLIITRRFMVAEPMMKVVPTIRRSAVPPYSATHQEFEVEIQHTGISIGNPREQIQLVVLQNGRWDRMQTDLEPSYTKYESIGYNLAGQLLFSGSKEFRPLDLRTFRFRTQQMEQIEELTDRFDIRLFPNTIRRYSPHVFTHDLNGRFFFECYDFPDDPLQSEYGEVLFRLRSKEALNGDVYVVGGFNDFQLQDGYRMTYNSEQGSYACTALFKNGFYDYQYILFPNDSADPIPTSAPIEGESFETENDYLFLVYYKEYGGLYDRLVAVQKFNTRPR